MPASVDYNIVGASAPFNFSVKDENNVERFLNIGGGKIFFTAPTNGIYTVTISKSDCSIKNQIVVNNCTSIPVVTPVSCIAPYISLDSVAELKAYISISSPVGTACSSLEIQYSDSENFTQYTSEFISCVNNTTLSFLSQDIYYVRVIKYCGIDKVYSNIISVNLKSTNCYTMAQCLGIGNDPNYDTYRVTLNNPASQNIQFLLSNLSNITVLKGQTYGEEIINITTGCPYILSNSVNLKYCGIITPVTPITPVVPVSTCVKVYAINNSQLADQITFTLCDGREQSYTLAPFTASPEVCIINENAWVSSNGSNDITIYKQGIC